MSNNKNRGGKEKIIVIEISLILFILNQNLYFDIKKEVLKF